MVSKKKIKTFSEKEIFDIQYVRRNFVYYTIEKGELQYLSEKNDEFSNRSSLSKGFIGTSFAIIIQLVGSHGTMKPEAEGALMAICLMLIIGGGFLWYWAKQAKDAYNQATKRMEEENIVKLNNK